MRAKAPAARAEVAARLGHVGSCETPSGCRVVRDVHDPDHLAGLPAFVRVDSLTMTRKSRMRRRRCRFANPATPCPAAGRSYARRTAACRAATCGYEQIRRRRLLRPFQQLVAVDDLDHAVAHRAVAEVDAVALAPWRSGRAACTGTGLLRARLLAGQHRSRG